MIQDAQTIMDTPLYKHQILNSENCDDSPANMGDLEIYFGGVFTFFDVSQSMVSRLFWAELF